MSSPDPTVAGRLVLTIGAVAELTGKRPSSIRYYEQIGLLPPAARLSGKRRCGADVLRTLAVIDTAQRAGLHLDEIKALLGASPDDGAATERLRQIADRRLPEIAALIERSELVRRWLECAARCECPNLDGCALFDDPSVLPGPAVRRPHRAAAPLLTATADDRRAGRAAD